MSDDDICGADTTGEQPCQNPATQGDSCWIESHGGTVSGHGRSFTLGEDDHDDILDAARLGKSIRGCARAAGVSLSQLQRYLEEHPDFRVAFERARSNGEDRLIRDGLYDEEADSSMAKFLLSTSFDYVKTEKREHEHSGADGGPLMVIERDGDD